MKYFSGEKSRGRKKIIISLAVSGSEENMNSLISNFIGQQLKVSNFSKFLIL